MKARILTAALLATLMSPSLAFAAESAGNPGGSWFKFGLYVINFAIFAFIIFYWAGPNTSNYLNESARLIRSDFERLQSGLREAQDLADRANARAAGIEDEIRKLAEGIDQETAFRVEKIRETGRVGVSRVRQDAELTAKALPEQAQRRLRARLAASASLMARDLVAQSFESSDQERLVEGFTDRLMSEAQR